MHWILVSKSRFHEGKLLCLHAEDGEDNPHDMNGEDVGNSKCQTENDSKHAGPKVVRSVNVIYSVFIHRREGSEGGAIFRARAQGRSIAQTHFVATTPLNFEAQIVKQRSRAV